MSAFSTVDDLLAHEGHIGRVQGISVGHFSDSRRPTGCTAVLCPQGAVGGVDVRGAAPGTRETDLLHPSNLVQEVHGIMLAGGSAWGLDAATGAVRWLEEQGAGLNIGVGRIPLVPAAVLFDVMMGDMRIRPDAAAGYAASRNAGPDSGTKRPAEGSVGAGSGAVVGKVFGHERAMKGGIGTASFTVDGVTVGAIIACNALGDVFNPFNGELLAGARTADGLQLCGTRDALLTGEINTRSPFLPRNLRALELAKQEEAKQRRVGLVVDEDWQARWYLDRLPPELNSVAGLDSWFGKLPAEQKKALEWPLAELLPGIDVFAAHELLLKSEPTSRSLTPANRASERSRSSPR